MKTLGISGVDRRDGCLRQRWRCGCPSALAENQLTIEILTKQSVAPKLLPIDQFGARSVLRSFDGFRLHRLALFQGPRQLLASIIDRLMIREAHLQ
ncbi:hypothetical protein GR232_31375 [Rhizobium leguminosarum]|nr:hypothetical protein [Rhizobium ruizarguesonis]NEI31319.1 hypothetical protein [Rhizobium ruizarguesonis]